MKSLILAFFATLALVASPASAQLAPAGNYAFSYAAGSYSGSGVITTDTSGLATAITGTATDSAFTSAILGLSSYAGGDNMLYVSDPFVTFAGLSFKTSFADFNLFQTGLASYALLDSRGNPQGFSDLSTTAQLNVSAVPEPDTWAMMLLGFGGIGGAMRRRRSSIGQTSRRMA